MNNKQANAERAAEIASKAISKSRARRRGELAEMMANGQLALWPESERGIPNEVVRCAVFSAKNRKEPRKVYRAASPLVVPVIGGGDVIWIGEELRQDDETVWMQLFHLAKEARSEWVTFTPHSFLQSIKWPIKDDSYKRLLTCIRRLAAGSLELYSDRLDKGLPTKMLANYVYSKNTKEPWKVRVFDKDDDLLFLFDKLYSRLDWETRLALPVGVATWLHGFFASHRDPFHHKVETLAIGAGLTLEREEDAGLPPEAREAKRKERLREARKTIKAGLDALKEKGFLDDYEVTRNGLVSVQRAKR
jgi:hypothetical protein